ncbi:FLYWCH-type domain-containing protein [Aphis craccivora]|uniref:FLYWCH-type domain-containing protein n=1 Tax=Aphis craccivora TaxID=307492 RepID=A0A6G0YL87_APHCR|nr:FLYWCH-type domain-containing protein [Aphis craccivora]
MSSNLQRTTNACESFHSRFNQSFYKESLSIIKWLTVLITEIQTDVYIKLKSTNISNNPQDHTVRNRQKKNDQIITDYKNGIIGRKGKDTLLVETSIGGKVKGTLLVETGIAQTNGQAT